MPYWKTCGTQADLINGHKVPGGNLSKLGGHKSTEMTALSEVFLWEMKEITTWTVNRFLMVNASNQFWRGRSGHVKKTPRQIPTEPDMGLVAHISSCRPPRWWLITHTMGKLNRFKLDVASCITQLGDCEKQAGEWCEIWLYLPPVRPTSPVMIPVYETHTPIRQQKPGIIQQINPQLSQITGGLCCHGALPETQLREIIPPKYLRVSAGDNTEMGGTCVEWESVYPYPSQHMEDDICCQGHDPKVIPLY